ncbi:type III pantothenate kinase [bacterium]|nr:type III pantothenate kinase [bacterium]
MKKQFLAIDVGNSNVVFGFYENEILLKTFRILTEKIEDFTLNSQEKNNVFGEDFTNLKSVAIASVVPPVTEKLTNFFETNFQVKPFLVTVNSLPGIELDYKTPQTLGVDRVCNAVAAHKKFPEKNIAIFDIGTATTLDVVTKDGKFIGGMIFPGPKTSLSALISKTAQLPEIELAFPNSMIGKNTVECIQAGILFGLAFQIDGIVAELCKEFSSGILVLATGGFAELVATKSKTIAKVEQNLVLEGIRLIVNN